MYFTFERFKCLLLVVAFVSCTLIAFGSLAETKATNFYTTWKLMKFQEKQQLVQGYKLAWQDFDEILDVLAEYVETNPKEAVQSISQLKSIYNLNSLRTEGLVREIDSFYNQSKNHEANFSKAVSAAKNQLG